MKTILTKTALILATALPLALAAGTLGLMLPAAFSASTLLAALVSTLTLLLFVTEYAPRPSPALRFATGAICKTQAQDKALHPLAA